MVALSTWEEKYIYGALSVCQVVWLMNLLQELKSKVSKLVKLMIGNKSITSLARNPVLHGISKHLDTKFHFLHNQV